MVRYAISYARKYSVYTCAWTDSLVFFRWKRSSLAFGDYNPLGKKVLILKTNLQRFRANLQRFRANLQRFCANFTIHIYRGAQRPAVKLAHKTLYCSKLARKRCKLARKRCKNWFSNSKFFFPRGGVASSQWVRLSKWQIQMLGSKRRLNFGFTNELPTNFRILFVFVS